MFTIRYNPKNIPGYKPPVLTGEADHPDELFSEYVPRYIKEELEMFAPEIDTKHLKDLVIPSNINVRINGRYPESFAAGIKPTEGMSKEEYDRLWPNRPAKIIHVGQ